MVITPGSTLDAASDELKHAGVIRSPFFFSLWVRLVGSPTAVVAGTYAFESRLSSLNVAHRLSQGIFGIDPIRVTIPEGISVSQMAQVYDWKLPDFDSKSFVHLAEPYEGYLFPDTYFFLPGTPPAQIVKEMRENFDKRMDSVSEKLVASNRELAEIVTMASLIEMEAKDGDERRLISGVLWNRIAIDMPLQVDAVFRYLMGKGSFDLTLEDLRHDSPYNTYVHRGLPPGPITNPGLDSILAAIEPNQNEYYYYLHDNRGRLHLAKTFGEHRENKFAYLR